jgi:hypothetical protein
MEAIRVLLRAGLGEREDNHVFDRHLPWGAKVQDYPEIMECLDRSLVPVLVELGGSQDLPRHRFISIDHHGARAGEHQPTALEQIFALIGAPPSLWTRSLALVAANDRGHLAAMTALNATEAEMTAIRAADRLAQGVTGEDETVGAKAARQATVRADGLLTLCHVANGHQTSVAADLLSSELGGPGYRNLLVMGGANLSFFGEGRWVRWLADHFPGGWSGGSLPVRGYWGQPQEADGQSRILAALEDAMTTTTDQSP